MGGKNATWQEALEFLQENSGCVFVHGKAGTGKSTLLTQYRLNTTKNCITVAPTGVAALHVGGETIHSCFGFAPSVSVPRARKEANFSQKKKLFKELHTLIIDEISMVRADLLDCIDVFLRAVRKDERPFGGVQVLMFGDLYQLPPIIKFDEMEAFKKLYASEYFFDAQVIKRLREFNLLHRVELEHVFRQKDADFLELLHAIREKSIEQYHFEMLHERVFSMTDRDTLILTGRNDNAKTINEQRLNELGTKAVRFPSKTTGKFDDKNAPTETDLVLKVGARVMFVANDTQNGLYVNGTLGSVKDIIDRRVMVQTDDGKTIEVMPHTWTMYETVFDEEKNALDQKQRGTFVQLPLKLAYAVTIHKSQGKTFDKLHIDLGSGAFANGQTYVALSRATSLQGITLARPLRPRDVMVDDRVRVFLESV